MPCFRQTGVSSCGADTAFNQTLQHRELVPVEPGDVAGPAPVDLDRIGKAVQTPIHRIAALGAGKKRNRVIVFFPGRAFRTGTPVFRYERLRKGVDPR